MKTSELVDDWIALQKNDALPDLSQEIAASELQRPRLVREHLGENCDDSRRRNRGASFSHYT